MIADSSPSTDPVSPPVRRVLAALEARGAAGRLAPARVGWAAACPAHADHGSALSLKQGGDGRALLRCGAGCDFAAVNTALGLTAADLFQPRDDSPASAGERIGAASELGELAVLGAVLIGVRLREVGFLAEVRAVLRPEDVDDPSIRAVFDAICALADEGSALTVPTIRLRAQAAVPGADPLTVINAAFDFADDVDADAVLDAARALRSRADARRYAAVLTAEAAAVRAGQTSPVAARARVQSAGEAITDLGTRQPSRFRLYSDLELAALPPMRWMVDGMLPAASLAAVIGAPEAGKSFVVLDLCASVATGRPFLGRHVDVRGPVLYVAAEGAPGLSQRAAAWRAVYGDGYVAPGEPIGIWFVTEGANLTTEADVAHVVRAAGQLPADPALIVFDTLARSMPGADENSAQDVGRVLHHAAAIQRQTGACVLVVHHTTKDGDTPRGSTTILGAVDTMWLVREEDGRRLLTCAKQKDAGHFETQYLELSPVGLASGATSCVIVAAGAEAAPPTPDTLSKQQREALLTLSRDFLTHGATASEWQKASRVPEGSFYRVRAALVRAGYVAEPAEAGRTGARYRITPNGEKALMLSTLPKAGQSTPIRPALSVTIGHYRGDTDSDSRTGPGHSALARGTTKLSSSFQAAPQGSVEKEHHGRERAASLAPDGAARGTASATIARDSRRDSESDSGARPPWRPEPPPVDDADAPEWVSADGAA